MNLVRDEFGFEDCLSEKDMMRTYCRICKVFSNSTALSIFNEVYRSVFTEMVNEKKGTGSNYTELNTDFVKDSLKAACQQK